MRIRAATAEDAPAFASIYSRCFEQEWSEHSFRQLLEDKAGFGLLAALNQEGEFESCVLARAAGDEAEILTLATVPGARRRGLASRLLQSAIEEAIRRGVFRMFLEVRESNRPAVELYEKRGFRAVGRRPAYFVSRGNSPADALILRKDLPTT